MEVIDYSERSIAVIGDTAQIKDQLKELGGRWNPNLTVNGEKTKGWIFSKKHEAAVLKLLSSGSKVKTPSKTPSKKPPAKEEEEDEYQEVTYRVLKPYKGQTLYLYTYPDDDLKNVPEATEATVLTVSPNKTKMTVSYEGNNKAVCIIIDGQWGLQYASFPNYLDIE